MASKERKQILLQYAAGITAAIGAAGYGANISWTSPAVSYLTSQNSHIPITKEQSDWIASLYPVGLMIGYLLNPLIIDRLGRKRTLLFLTVPQIISWAMIILAKDCLIIYIARILGGIGYGAKICSLTVYLSEIGSNKNRGIFLVFLPVFINTGMLYVMILGVYLSYNLMNIALFILPIIFFATFFFMPESSYFREKNDDVKMKSLLNLPKSGEVNKNAKITQLEGFYASTLRLKESRLWKLVALRNNRKALMTVIFLSAYIAFSGDIALTYFTEQILAFSGFYLSAKKATIILTSVRVVASLISIPLVERVRRKMLLLSTGFFASISMGIVGIFFFLEKQEFDVSFIRWFPLAGILVYEFFFVTGVVNLFYIFVGEFFMTEVKGTAVTICKIILTLFTFLSLFRFHEMVDLLEIYMIFFMFSACGATAIFIVYIITPETKGKRLDEIQVLLKSKKMFYF